MSGYLINRLKEIFFWALDIPFVSPELARMGRPLLLQVSDTPGMCYRYIARLLRRLRPEYLVHTGDIADEIKLEFAPAQVGEYRQKLQRFLQLIEGCGLREVYLVPGNHDDLQSLRQEASRCSVIGENETVSLGAYRFLLQHQYRPDGEGADFQLYGHTPEPESDLQARPARLNGLNRLNVISLQDGTVYSLPYPGGTDSARKMLSLKLGM